MHSLTLRKGSWDVEFTTEKQFFPNAVDQNLTTVPSRRYRKSQHHVFDEDCEMKFCS